MLYKVTDVNEATSVVEANSGDEAVYIALPHYPRNQFVVEHHDCDIYMVTKPRKNKENMFMQFVQVQRCFNVDTPTNTMKLVRLYTESNEGGEWLLHYRAVWQAEDGRELTEAVSCYRWNMLATQQNALNSKYLYLKEEE